ncbi:hypothetical protein [Mameliella alba]|uniref:Uncharacterized protein n=2 Tax=Mameliella alba TaxID=561184 RepID=A0A0B3S506_9RHOB|nr:hypothetical protein [Mameliella alba]KHQ51771.1 hypothetical protein OA50_03672 [Mameliella alba]
MCVTEQRHDRRHWARGLATGALVLALAGGAACADVVDARRQINDHVARAFAQGWVMPGVRDLDRYHGDDLVELQQVLDMTGGDDCARAVMTALYLDAHLPPDMDVLFDDYAMSLLAIWKMPDEWDLLSLMASGWTKVVLDGANTGRKLVLTPDAILEANRQRVAQNRARWVQEMVQHALMNGWDGNVVQRAQQMLRDKAARNVAEIEAEMVLAAEAMKAPLAARDAAYAEADRQFRKSYEEIFGPPDVQGAVPERDVGNDERLRIIENVRDDARAVADRAFDAALSKIEARRNREVGIDLQEVAQARLQSLALSHYVLPIIEGRCAEIAQRMSLADPAPQPVRDDPGPAAPQGGHWAMVSQGGMTTFTDNNSCYEPKGSVGAGSGQFSHSKPRCGDAWDAYVVTYTWAAPPPYLVPGQEVPLSASVQGDYAAGWGHGGLFYYYGTEGENCAKGSRATVDIVKDRTDGFIGTAYNQAPSAAWSGTFAPPEGARYKDGRFQMTVTLQPLGCYRYVYEWRE